MLYTINSSYVQINTRTNLYEVLTVKTFQHKNNLKKLYNLKTVYMKK